MCHFQYCLLISATLFLASCVTTPDKSLLFYLSGESINADIAAGQAEPNFAERVSIVPDGAKGKAIRAHYRNAYSYLAPGNIYSDRGTISFFWRSGEPLTETEFPLWRVSFADHSSWDMVWMRIDWNGHGYDAFVTDNNLVRVRLSTEAPTPKPDEWIHLAFCWDESEGVRLYLNGRMLARRDTSVCLNTGLDQFGPHQRIVSPYQVQSAYIIQRGGDIDEVRIYDHALGDSDIRRLSHKKAARASEDKGFDEAGWLRYLGFDKALPPYLDNEFTSVRRVEIADAWDYKRWYWKAFDGLRETTWPGVYNRSSIEGRTDYFILPDWDCYSFSGKEMEFDVPEPWNYMEVTGGAYGKFTAAGFDADKPQATQRSFLMADRTVPAGRVKFENTVRETPIQEICVFNISDSAAPRGEYELEYGVKDYREFRHPALKEIETYIDGRFRRGSCPVAHIVIPSDLKDIDQFRPPVIQEIRDDAAEFGANSSWNAKKGFPCWDRLHAGLDGILLHLPALEVQPYGTSGLVPLNIAVMDPLDPMRYMLDFSFCVKPGEARTIWLDTRDRIMPEGKPLYIRISSASPDFDESKLEDCRIRLIFKDFDASLGEHIADRMNQVRDNHGTLVEEATSNRRYLKFRRLENDLNDLLKVAPRHPLANRYKYFYYPESSIIDYREPVAPKGVPEWAWLQLQIIARYRYLAQWYLDNRQAPNGEFGGGLSDDSTFTRIYVDLAEMGVMAERSADALLRSLQAIYDNGMLTDGVSTIQSDGLHTYEEGEISTVQAAVACPDDSLCIRRLLASAKGVRKTYLGVNDAGHLHLKGDYYGYGKAALKGYWGWNSKRGNFHLHTLFLAADRYGDEESRNVLMDYFNSLFAHAVEDPEQGLLLPSEINYLTDDARLPQKFYADMLAYLWKWTGDEKYLKAAQQDYPFESMPAEELPGLYREILRYADIMEWYNTHGSPYIDRVKQNFTAVSQQRLGGPCMMLPMNLVSWRFENGADAEKIAINVSYSLKDDEFSVDLFNTSGRTARAYMTGRRAADGKWTLSDGAGTRQCEFGFGKTIRLDVPAGQLYTVRMKADR